MKYKNYLCNNLACLKHFRRPRSRLVGCKSKEFCSVECCIEDTIETEGLLDDYCGCEDCLGGEKGFWVFIDHISKMCGEPAWFDFNWFKAHAIFHAMVQMPIGYIHSQEDINKARIIQNIIKSSGTFIRKISLLSDEEMYVEIGKIGIISQSF